ncbi:hypothetical protein ACKI1O_47065, partial [Streptomyces scabiei]
TDYVVSFMINSSVDISSWNTAIADFRNGDSSKGITWLVDRSANVSKNKDTKVWFHLKTFDSIGISAQTFYLNGGLPAGTYKFWDFKLEQGTIATDYSVADADLATVTALSSVSQKADSISTTVTNNKTDADNKFTNINQTISGI